VSNRELIEGIDFYWKEISGLRFKVFTEIYLVKRGYCCNNNCIHCPYKKNENGKQKK
jgi:hypothetical protein